MAKIEINFYRKINRYIEILQEIEQNEIINIFKESFFELLRICNQVTRKAQDFHSE